MNELKIFNYQDSEIRTAIIDDEPWWVANDVCSVLGFSNPSETLKRLELDEVNSTEVTDSLGRKQMTNIVNEPGLYSLILGSRKPEAKAFKRWITHEVIPTIRRHGAYMTPEKIEQVLADPDTIIKLATELKRSRTEIAVRDQLIGELKPKADYVDMVLKSTGLMTISQIAKDYGMSGQKLNQILKDKRIQYKQNGQWLLYAKHQDKSYTHSKTIDFTHSDGRPGTKLDTQWTQKGRLFIYAQLKTDGILPMIERGTVA